MAAKRLSKSKKGGSKRKQSTTPKPDFDDQDYEVKEILEESDEKYLVRWADSWISKDWANSEAIRSWEETKRQRLLPRQSVQNTQQTQPDSSGGAADEKVIDESLTRSSSPLTELVSEGSTASGVLFEPARHQGRPSIDSSSSQPAQIEELQNVQSTHNHSSQAQKSQQSQSNSPGTFTQPDFSAYQQGQNIRNTIDDTSEAIQSQDPFTFASEVNDREPSGHQERGRYQFKSDAIQSTAESNHSPAQIHNKHSLHGLEPSSLTDDIEFSNSSITKPSTMTSQAQIEVAALAASHPHLMDDMNIPAVLPPGSPLLRSRQRSPSTVPAFERSAPFSQEEQNTSERLTSLLPPFEENNHVELSNTIATPLKHKNFHTLAVPLVGHQRDQYQRLPDAEMFELLGNLSTSSDPADIEKAENMIQRLRTVALHPDLDNQETYTQYDVPASAQAEWDTQCSSKFSFLDQMLSKLHNHDLTKHVTLSCNPGDVAEKVGRFLVGRNHIINATAEQIVNLSDINVSSPASIEYFTDSPKGLLIIDLDGYELSILKQLADSGATVVSLVVPCTVDHIERSLPPGLVAKTVAIAHEVKRCRKEAGRTSGNTISIAESAAILVQHLTGSESSVDLALPELDVIQLQDSENGSANDVNGTTGLKRAFEADSDESDSVKRQRLDETNDLPTTIQLSEIEAPPMPIANLSLPGTNVDIRPDIRLREVLQEEQKRRIELETDMSDLQYQFEELRKQLNTAMQEREAAVETAQKALERLTNNSSDNSSARKELINLRSQIVELNAKLLDHSVPERVEIEKERQDREQAILTAEKATNRLTNIQKDLDYAKSMYQEASSTAQQLAGQNAELEQRLVVAERAASGERARLRQMSNDMFAKNMAKQINLLKATLSNRDMALKFRDEEIARLKDISRGRMGTRNSSVPRSPRMNSPLKDQTRTISRHASPAFGEVRDRARLHPLRND